MDNKYQNIDEAFIGLCLSGNASEQELDVLAQWLAESEANQLQFEQIQKIWDTAQELKPHVSFNSDAAWDKVKNKIDNSSGNIISLNNIKPFTGWFAAAASVLVILSISIWYFIGNKNTNQFESIVATTDNQQIYLADSTTVILSKGATLSFSKNYNATDRKTKLEGKALFNVKKDPSKPFLIDAGLGEITVLGTSFIVNATKDSCITLVKEGSVKFNVKNKEKEHEILKAGDRASINNFKKLSKQNNVNIEYETYQFNKTIVFEQTPLIEAVDLLNTIFNSNIILENQELENCLLSATFVNDDLENILKVIAETFNLQLNQVNSQFSLKGDGC